MSREYFLGTCCGDLFAVVAAIGYNARCVDKTCCTGCEVRSWTGDCVPLSRGCVAGVQPLCGGCKVWLVPTLWSAVAVRGQLLAVHILALRIPFTRMWTIWTTVCAAPVA
jgi:hypothetical protein